MISYPNLGSEALILECKVPPLSKLSIGNAFVPEEKILFPAFEEKGGEEAEEMVLEGVEEHHVTKFMMDRLSKADPEDKTFDAKFKVLMESSKHHFMEEEREIFPKAKKVLEGELDRLGEEMEAFEKKIKK